MKRFLLGTMVCGLALLVPGPAGAGVTLGFDVETLNEILPALSASRIDVPIAGGSTLGLFLEEMQVTGLDPATDDGGQGHILTSMRVRIPSLGIELPVKPRLSIHVARGDAASLLELRFEQVEIPLPLAGSIDAAPFLPPLRFPAENLWLVAGAEGDVRIRSRLESIEMGVRVVRFEFELKTVPSP